MPTTATSSLENIVDLPPLRVPLASLRAVCEQFGPDYTLQVEGHGPTTLHELAELLGHSGQLQGVTVSTATLELKLARDAAELSWTGASDQAQSVHDLLEPHRLRWRWLTHDDLALLAGMALPAVAACAVPPGWERLAAALGAGPWLGYLLWVRHNGVRNYSAITADAQPL